MGASAGRYGVNIGTGAAGGAMAGAAFGPIGMGIGAGIGAIGGGLSTLLSSSDEAKERERQKKLYLQQMKERAEQDSTRRMAAIMGFAGSPMDIALSGEPYDEAKASADFDAGMPAEPTPDYGRLVQSLGQLGGSVGQMSRTSALQDQLAQRSYDARVQATGNPWQQYADNGNADELEELLKQARARSPGITGAR